MEVVKPSAGSGALQKAKPSNGLPVDADRPSYVTVAASSARGDVSGCRIMFFQGGRLSATGTSGAAIKLDPGSYLVQISRDGYKTFAEQKYLNSGSQTITVFLQPE